ncbi:MAG: hypothetical protein ABEI78_01435 [Candidatus Nanohaloarchaea archaeon]
MGTNKRKGQVSIEFLLLLGLAMFALSIVLGFIATKQRKAIIYSNTKKADKIADDIAFQAEMALVMGKGYTRKFVLPARIGGKPYNVTVTQQHVVVQWKNQNLIQPTLYQGRELYFETQNQYRFKIINNGSVYITKP